MLADQSDTKTRLMRAAMDIVARDGFQAATTAAIAESAGLAEGTLYRHYKSKEDLLLAVYRQIKAEVFESMRASSAPGASLETQFRGLWIAVWTAYREDMTAFTFGQRFGESPLSRIDGGAAHEPMIQHIHALIDAGQSAGQIKPVPRETLLVFFFAPLTGLLKQANAGRDLRESDLAAAIDMAWHSWAAR